MPEQVAEQTTGPECTLRFSGQSWCVRRTWRGGPGPNAWSAHNVWVDEAGLHLKLSQVEGQWIAAEVYTSAALGFGTYEFRLGPGVAQLDRPRSAGAPPATHPGSWAEPGASVHRYTWSSGQVLFQSQAVSAAAAASPARQWRYAPKRGARVLPQLPMPVHLNLWLYRGMPPSDGREVEVVIESFRYTPDRTP